MPKDLEEVVVENQDYLGAEEREEVVVHKVPDSVAVVDR